MGEIFQLSDELGMNWFNFCNPAGHSSLYAWILHKVEMLGHYQWCLSALTN